MNGLEGYDDKHLDLASGMLIRKRRNLRANLIELYFTSYSEKFPKMSIYNI